MSTNPNSNPSTHGHEYKRSTKSKFKLKAPRYEHKLSKFKKKLPDMSINYPSSRKLPDTSINYLNSNPN